MKKLFFIILLFISVTAVFAERSPQILTLDEILKITLENNQEIKAAKEQLAGSESLMDGSGKWSNPELLIGSNIGDNKDNIILSQTFDIKGKYSLKRKKAELETIYTESKLEETCIETSLQAKLKYYDFCRSVQQLKLQEKNIEVFKEAIKKAEIQYNLGNIPQADLLRLQLEQAKIEQAMLHGQNQLRLARSSLFKIMGIEEKEGIEIRIPDMVQDKIAELKLEELLALAIEDRPLIKGQKALIQSKEFEINIAKSDRYPDLIVSYWRDTLEATSLQAAELRLAFPLWDYGSIRGQVGFAEASQRQEEALLSSIKSQISLEVKDSYYEFQESSYLLVAFKDKILTNSDELLWKAQYGYEEGAFSYLQFIDALKTYNDTQSEYIQAFYDYYSSIARCERVTGTKVVKGEE